MKYIRITIILLFVISGFVIGYIIGENNRLNYSKHAQNIDIRMYKDLIAHTTVDNAVPDEITAQKIADAVLSKTYGKLYYSIRYDTKANIWMVYGTKQNPLFGLASGGGAEIIIQKSDGKILGMWGSK